MAGGRGSAAGGEGHGPGGDQAAGEGLSSYTARILATPGALLVKEADLAHNADPARLAVLDEPTRTRLTAKYAQVRGLLGLVGGESPSDRKNSANPGTH